jgi:DNA-binding NarL/FixJ family response regulator
VLVADDHEVVRLGLEQLLANYEEFELLACATDGESAIKLAKELAPDVIIMDVSMPGIGGIEATRRLLQDRPEARVIAFTAHDDRERVLDALDAGAIGYLLKGSEPDELIRGLRAAARGESPLAPAAAAALLGARAARRPAAEITGREREVLTLLAGGMSNKQIARRLGISEKTVKGHLTSIFQRIGVADRTQAALWAERHGLLKTRSGRS